MNKNIILEFEKLISYNENKLRDLKENNDKYVNYQNFRIKQLKNVLNIIKKYNKKITLKNYIELSDISGIGRGTLDRIKEILETSTLKETKDFKDVDKDKKKIINQLSEVINIGPSKATELYDLGVTSVSDLKKKISSKEIKVNDKINLGLKYYNKYKTKIPRKEITRTEVFLKKIIDDINLTITNNKLHLVICGSYRRGKDYSNDIDILITRLNSKKGDKTFFTTFINKLKEKIKINNNSPFLIDDLTDKNIKTKYMGFSKYKDNSIRRIDIRYVSYPEFYFALLYFTGSKDLNKRMREVAKKKGYKLSEYGLFDSDNNTQNVKSEKKIFELLDLKYLTPEER